MINDDTIYTALHDEVLSNNARMTSLQYWSVLLATAVLGPVALLSGSDSVDPPFVAAILFFVSVVTLLLFSTVQRTGESSLRIGAYLLAIERKHDHDHGWEHYLEHRRTQNREAVEMSDFWKKIPDVEVFLQFAYLGSAGYFAYVSRHPFVYVVCALIALALVFTFFLIQKHPTDLKVYRREIREVEKWMNG